MEIKLGFNHRKWNDWGLKVPIVWDSDKIPHLLIAGTTGGGKTVLSQLVLNQLLSANADIYVCDFKAGGDWSGIFDDTRYGEYLNCDEILDSFYEMFVATIIEKKIVNRYLIFDEFSSYVLSKDSKAQKDIMAKVGHIAFMGRSFGVHLILISQQYSAKVIDTAIREQFGIKVYMGTRISSESAYMLFPNCSIDKSKHLPKYAGYISTQEDELSIIRIPFIENTGMLKKLLEQKGKIYEVDAH